MNFTCGWYVANSILKKSFEDIGYKEVEIK